MPTLYVDESGFTGTRFDDETQPAYTVAVVHIDEERAQALRQRYFPQTQMPELKYKTLRKNERNLPACNALLEDLLDQGVIKLSGAHKRYAAVVKMFDLVYEPALYRRNIDAYAGGFIARLSTDLYKVMNTLAPEPLTRCIQAFRVLVQSRDEPSREGFRQALQGFGEDAKLQEILNETLIPALDELDLSTLELGRMEDATGLVTTCGLLPVAQFATELPGPVQVIYDQSNVMVKESPLWNWYLSPTSGLGPFTIPFGDVSVTFPLSGSTTLGDSKQFVGLQIADLAAGLFNHMLTELIRGNALSQELETTRRLLLRDSNVGGHVNLIMPTGPVRDSNGYGQLLERMAVAMAQDPHFPE